MENMNISMAHIFPKYYLRSDFQKKDAVGRIIYS